MKTCCFLGHKNCDKSIKQNLFTAIETLITTKNVTTFYVGTQGNYDKYVYEVFVVFTVITF